MAKDTADSMLETKWDEVDLYVPVDYNSYPNPLHAPREISFHKRSLFKAFMNKRTSEASIYLPLQPWEPRPVEEREREKMEMLGYNFSITRDEIRYCIQVGRCPVCNCHLVKPDVKLTERCKKDYFECEQCQRIYNYDGYICY